MGSEFGSTPLIMVEEAERRWRLELWPSKRKAAGHTASLGSKQRDESWCSREHFISTCKLDPVETLRSRQVKYHHLIVLVSFFKVCDLPWLSQLGSNRTESEIGEAWERLLRRYSHGPLSICLTLRHHFHSTENKGLLCGHPPGAIQPTLPSYLELSVLNLWTNQLHSSQLINVSP